MRPKKRNKKIIAMVVLVMLIIGLFPANVFAAYTPPAPTKLRASAEDAQSIYLEWARSPGSDKTEIWGSDSSNTESYTLLQTKSGEWFYEDGLSASKTRYYKLRAVDTEDNTYSPFTDPVSCTTNGTTQVIPSPPQGLSSKIVKLTWSAPGPDHYDYYVYRSESQNGNFQYLYDTDRLYYTENNLNQNTTYWYQVIAKNDAGYGSPATVSVITPSENQSPPEPPTISSISAISSSQIQISWGTVNGAQSYNIYRTTNIKNAPWQKINSTESLSYTDSGLTRKTEYYYKISAVNQIGESVLSGIQSVETNAIDGTVYRPQITSPTSNAVLNKSDFWVTWSCQGNYLEYEVTVSEVNSASMQTQIISEMVNGTTYKVDGSKLKEGEQYCIFVGVEDKPSNFIGDSVTVTISGVAVQKPSRPTNLDAEPKSSSQIDLTWDTSSDAKGYNIYRAITDSSGRYYCIATIGGSSYSDTSLQSNTTYWYKVTAYNDAGESDRSNLVGVTTKGNEPDAPQGLNAVANSSSEVRLDWQKSLNANGYKVYRSVSGENGEFTSVNTVSNNSYMDTALSPGTSYWYKVYAYNNAGTSKYSSSIIQITTKAAAVNSNNSTNSETNSNTNGNTSGNTNGNTSNANTEKPVSNETATPTTPDITTTLILSVGSPNVSQDGNISKIDASNGKVVPINEGGRVMVPIMLAKAFGATLDWDSTTLTATLNFGSKNVTFTNGSKIMTVQGKQTVMEVPAELKENRLYIHIRALADALGTEVSYSGGVLKIGKDASSLTSNESSQLKQQLTPAPLTVTIDSLKDGQIVTQGEKKTISATATSGYNITSMQVYMEGKAFGPKSNTGSISVPWNTEGNELRTHTIKVEVTDDSGGKPVSQEITVNIVPSDGITVGTVTQSKFKYTTLGHVIVYQDKFTGSAAQLAVDRKLCIIDENGVLREKTYNWSTGEINDNKVVDLDGYGIKFQRNSVYIMGTDGLYLNTPNGDSIYGLLPKDLTGLGNKIAEQQYIYDAAKAVGNTDVMTKSHARADAFRAAAKGNFTDTYVNYKNMYFLAQRQYEGFTVQTIVKEIQDSLESLGYSFTKVDGQNDGKFGNEVFNALAYYQRTNGLDANGQLDQAMYDLIKQRSSESLKIQKALTSESPTLGITDKEYIMGLYTTLQVVSELENVKNDIVTRAFLTGGRKIGVIDLGNGQDSQLWNSYEVSFSDRIEELKMIVYLNPKFEKFNDDYHEAQLFQKYGDVDQEFLQKLISEVYGEYASTIQPELNKRAIEGAKAVGSFAIDMTVVPGFIKSVAECSTDKDLITQEPIPNWAKKFNVGVSAIPVIGGTLKDVGKGSEELFKLGKTTFTVDEIGDMAKVEGELLGSVVDVKDVVTFGKLKFIGNPGEKKWVSSQGLIYGEGSREGNKVLHAIAHTKPNPAKPIHTVFNVSTKDILGLIDEAWSKRLGIIPILQSNGNELFKIPMGKIVGTNGENGISIVVEAGTSRIVTSFPISLP